MKNKYKRNILRKAERIRNGTASQEEVTEMAYSELERLIFRGENRAPDPVGLPRERR